MSSQAFIEQAVFRILKPLAKMAIRYGLSAATMNELVRRAYVDAAEATLTAEGKKTHTSRICALTGFYRKEVVRIKALPSLGDNKVDERYNRSSRVVAGWLRDQRFTTKTGRPAVLPLDGDSGFNALVKRYSGDMTARAMLDELQRLGIVKVSERRTVKLVTRAYIPQAEDTDALQILGTDTGDLIETIYFNIGRLTEDRRFQRKVMYLHIPERYVNHFKRYAAGESQKLLEKLDRWLALKDTEPRSKGTPGSRLGLGIYMIDSVNDSSVNSEREDATR